MLQYLGGGDVLNLPFEARDRLYFFKQWSTAYAKYMISPHVADTGMYVCTQNSNPKGICRHPGPLHLLPGLHLDRRHRCRQRDAAARVRPFGAVPRQGGGCQVGDFSQQPIDSDTIFDTFGGAARSEFISFDFADGSHDPVDIEQKILVLGSNLQNTNFYRKPDRAEERARSSPPTRPTRLRRPGPI